MSALAVSGSLRMSTFKLLLAEIRYRKLNFALSLLAVTIAVALFVTGPILIDGYGHQTETELKQLHAGVVESQARVAQSEREADAALTKLEDDTRIAMRDMGFNLEIVHRDTDTIDFNSSQVPTLDMPQEYIDRLAADRSLTMITHLVAILREKITWGDHQVLLDGYLPEATQSHMRRKAPMGYILQPGTVYLGYHLGKHKKVGETIEVLGKEFRLAAVFKEQGSRQDSTIAMHLSDAQALLAKPDRIEKPINLILALDCRCAEADLPLIRKQLADALPETHVIRDRSKAAARANQRAMVKQQHDQIVALHRRDLEQRQNTLAETEARRAKIQQGMETLAGVMTWLVVLGSAVWVGLLAWSNVRERVTEIGVLRALGKSSTRIAALFLGKAIILGLLGAATGFSLGAGLGYAIGTDATQSFGFRPLYAAADHFTFPYDLLVFALVGAPLLSAMASYLPTLFAVTQDPAVVLRDK